MKLSVPYSPPEAAKRAAGGSLRLGRTLLITTSGLLLFLLVWQIVTDLGIWDAYLLPSPRLTWNAIVELADDGNLWKFTGVSLYRFFTGYLIAVVLAIPLGLLLGNFVKALRIANPVLQILRPISPTAWFPFIVLWFGIGDAPAIVIIAIAGFFPILFSTIAAVASIPPIYLKVARNFGLSRIDFFRKIALPAALPRIMTGLHIAIGTAWIFLVAGEMVGAQAGLGYLIVDARNNLRTDMVLAGIFIIGIAGWILDTLMRRLEQLVCPEVTQK